VAAVFNGRHYHTRLTPLTCRFKRFHWLEPFLAGLNDSNDLNPIMVCRTLGEIRWQMRRGAKNYDLRCQVNLMLRRSMAFIDIIMMKILIAASSFEIRLSHRGL
jgi:hypothetical protein